MSTGYPSRGIISCRDTPTEALQDYVDFLTNPSMRNQKSYIRDTKRALQLIKESNEEGRVTEYTNLVTADFENMYGKMPLDLSTAGVRENYCQQDGESDQKPSTEKLMEALDICQENNVFDFGAPVESKATQQGRSRRLNTM